MLGPTQLDVNHFPSIKLRSVSFDPTNQDTAWHLVAEVELHGVTRKVKFSLDCQQVGDKLQIRGKKMFKLTDFDVKPFSTAFGAVRIKNDFEVTYNVVLERMSLKAQIPGVDRPTVLHPSGFLPLSPLPALFSAEYPANWKLPR